MGTSNPNKIGLTLFNTLTPDFLAFLTVLFFATRSGRRIPGLKGSTTLGIIMEDATLYFLVIFTAHFVLEMTLIFGRVNTTTHSLKLQSLTTNLCHSRDQSNFFQARKLLPAYPVHNHLR